MPEPSRRTYRRIATSRAHARIEFKWIRGLIVSAVGSPVIASIRAGRLATPRGVLDFLVPFALFALWEGCRFLWQRFFVIPDEIYTEQDQRIRDLEIELSSAKVALSATRANKAFANSLRALDQRGVAELWAVQHPLNQYESPKWIAKLDAWEADLMAEVRKGGDDGDLYHVQTLGNIHDPAHPRPYAEPVMNQRLAMLNIRRKRIHDLIKKYDPDAP